MIEYLLGAICLVAAVTIIGHAIWTAFAAVMRGFAPPNRQPQACPECGTALDGAPCQVCKWPAPGIRIPDWRLALRGLSDQIQRLADAGALDAEARENLFATVERERLRREALEAAAPVARPATAAQPVPEPTPEIVAAEVIEEASPPLEPAPPRLPPPPFRRPMERVVEPTLQPAPVAAVPPAPRRSWSDLVSAFMEERNMRWGELVGGLLIVCCSIALVVSFWSQIEQRPWLKFSLFGGVTSAIFGVGFYCEHRWRLRTTSQGLLSIGCLLVPLNFLAIAALSSAPDAGGILTVAGELVSAALFAVFVYFAGRVLVHRDAAALAAGLIVPALAQLLIRRFVAPGVDDRMLRAMVALPVGCYLVVNLWHLRQVSRLPLVSEVTANALFKFLGLTSFAVVLPLALLLYKSGAPFETLCRVPVVAPLVGLVPLCAGLLIWQRLADRPLAGLRTAGGSIALLGAAVSLAGFGFAWPEPVNLLPVAAIEFAVFTLVAWRFGMPALHLLAAPCLALGYLLVAHLVQGAIAWDGNGARWMVAALVSGESGVLLAPLVSAYAGIALLAARRQMLSARFLAIAAGGLMTASVLLVSWFGFGYEGDPLGAGWVYLLYAAIVLGVSARARAHALPWAGAALLLAGVIQEVAFHHSARLQLAHPWIASLLCYATLLAVLAAVVERFRIASAHSPLARVAWRALLTASLVVATLLLGLIPTGDVFYEAVYWGWLTALWLAAAVSLGWLPIATLFQLGLVATTVFATGTALARQPWFRESPWPWLDPWTLEAVGFALAGLNLLWAIVRLGVRKRSSGSSLTGALTTPWLAVDRATTVGIIIGLLSLSSFGLLPHVLAELAPQSGRPLVAAADVTIPFIHEHVGGAGSWAVLAALVAVIGVTLRERASRTWLTLLVLATFASVPLVAGWFAPQRAAATASVWLSMLFLLGISGKIWGRRLATRNAERLGWPTLAGDTLAIHNLTACSFALSLAAPLLVAGYIVCQAIGQPVHAPLGTGMFTSMPWLAGLVFGLAVLWSLRGEADRADAALGLPNWPISLPALLVWLSVTAVALSIAMPLAATVAARPPLGPLADSFFARMGRPLADALPLVAFAAVLAGFGLRERSGTFGLAGGVVLILGVALGWLVASAPDVAVAEVWIRMAQIAAAVSALYTFAWLGIATWDASREGRYGIRAQGIAFVAQTALPAALLALAIGWAWLQIVGNPDSLSDSLPSLARVADVFGWSALALVAITGLVTARAADRGVNVVGIAALATAMVTLVSGIASHWDQGDWLSYNTLLVGHALIAALFIALAWYSRRSHSVEAEAEHAGPMSGAIWSVVQVAAVIGLATFEFNDSVWWTSGGWALAGVVFWPALAWIFQQRRYLYLAAPLVNMAVLLVAIDHAWIDEVSDFVCWNVLLLAAPVAYWMLIEQRSIARRTFQSWLGLPPVHRIVTRLALVLLAIIVALELSDAAGGMLLTQPRHFIDGWALAATLLAAIVCLWDAKARDAVALVYLTGLAGCGLLIARLDLPLASTATFVLATYTLLTCYLWSVRRQLAGAAAALGIPRRDHDELAGQLWIVPFSSILIAAVVALTWRIEMSDVRTEVRLLASQATLVQVLSLGLLARGRHRTWLQYAALSIGALGAVYFGWAWLVPGDTLTWLNALVVVAAATAAVGALYGLGLGKVLAETSDWLPAALRLTPVLAATSTVALAATLSLEVWQYLNLGEVRIALWAVAIVGSTLAVLAAAALAAAVLPGRDPLGLSERGRTTYVYIAEILLGLLFVHIRVTMPWLFTGFYQQFWPLIVMGLAYLGVGCAELLRRREQHVLAEPLDNTGILLPVLPVIGYWVADSRVDYSLLLFCVGTLYAGLSIARRSFGFGVLAAIAANGGLWFFLNRQENWGFFEHPQVWLIPPAVCVLAAAYLNRRQLTEAQMTAIRYITSMAIYISSTADIFLNGVAQAPMLPLVLAGLSILGIVAGIMLRVRAFLFLGTGFLVLSLFTVIWHAAVDRDQTWIWWVSGIVAGLLVLATVAVFEKRRQDILAALDRLKQWEA